MPFSLRLLPTLLTLMSSFAAAAINGSVCQRIETGPGPSDLLVQHENGQARLLISSHDRRHFSRGGEIQTYNPASGQLNTLTRVGEPKGFRLRPHGMDLVQRDGHWLLYVISHDRDLISDQHAVVIYELSNNTLKFLRLLRNPLLSAADDLAVADNDDIYVTNERETGSSIVELIFLERKATLVLYRPSVGWRKVAGELAFANDVLLQGNTVWVSQTLGEGLMRYPRQADGSLGAGEKVTNLSRINGLREARNGHLLATQHASLIRLGLHWQRASSSAPSAVLDINPQNGNSTVLFQDDGSHIGAVSSALQLDNRLFLGQLFDPYILSCPLITESL